MRQCEEAIWSRALWCRMGLKHPETSWPHREHDGRGVDRW